MLRFRHACYPDDLYVQDTGWFSGSASGSVLPTSKHTDLEVKEFLSALCLNNVNFLQGG